MNEHHAPDQEIAYRDLVPAERRARQKEVAAVFLKLGTIAFGGPAAHIAMMDDELVKKRKWLSRDQFLDLLGASNLIPGPNSTELAIHIGYQRAGWLGLLLAGSCFIVPAMLIVLLFAVMYTAYGTVPAVGSILYGIKPVIFAIVLQALWGLGCSAVKNVSTGIAGAAVVVLTLLGLNEILLLALAGLGVMLIYNRHRIGNASASLFLPLPGLYMADLPEKAAPSAMSLSALFFTFLKIGSVLYGSGYVLLAFLQTDFVDRTGAITAQQLLDSVAIGQFTPGPVFTTATFIGYLIDGVPGALLATLAIFLPAFVFVALTHRLIAKLRRSPWMSGFLDGVNVASLALMGLVSWKLGYTALVDGLTVGLAAVALLLVFRLKINSAWLVLGGGLIGFLLG